MKGLCTAIFTIVWYSAFSQNIITGLVFNDLGLPIQNIKVFNKQNGTISLSDSSGHFKAYVQIGDTLIFSGIGYKKAMHGVSERFFIQIRLETDTIALQTIMITEYPSYAQLKKQLLDMPPISTDPFNTNIHYMLDYDTTSALEDIKIPDPVTEIYPGVKIHWLYLKTTVNIYAVYDEIKRTSKKRKLAASGEMPKW